MHITMPMTAGQRLEFYEDGDFFRLMAGTAPVTVEYYFQGQEIAEGTLVSVGYAEKFNERKFDRIAITSSANQTLTFATRLGNEVHYDTPPKGQVTVTNVNGAFTQSNIQVTTATVQLLAANPLRSYLLIQNNDTTGIVWVHLAGGAFTATNGIKIEPGGSIELQGFVPNGVINAKGDIAANNNVVIVEG